MKYIPSTLEFELIVESAWVRLLLARQIRTFSAEIINETIMPKKIYPGESTNIINRISSLERLLSWFPWSRSCLVKAISIKRVLARRGVSSRIKFGALGTLNALKMHAWIEVDGKEYLRGTTRFNEFAPSPLTVEG